MKIKKKIKKQRSRYYYYVGDTKYYMRVHLHKRRSMKPDLFLINVYSLWSMCVFSLSVSHTHFFLLNWLRVASNEWNYSYYCIYFTSNISKYYSLQFFFQIAFKAEMNMMWLIFQKRISCYLMSKKAAVWCFIEKKIKRDVREHTEKIVNALIIVLVPVKKKLFIFFCRFTHKPMNTIKKRDFLINLIWQWIFAVVTQKFFCVVNIQKLFIFISSVREKDVLKILCAQVKFALGGRQKVFPSFLLLTVFLWF